MTVREFEPTQAPCQVCTVAQSCCHESIVLMILSYLCICLPPGVTPTPQRHVTTPRLHHVMITPRPDVGPFAGTFRATALSRQARPRAIAVSGSGVRSRLGPLAPRVFCLHLPCCQLAAPLTPQWDAAQRSSTAFARATQIRDAAQLFTYLYVVRKIGGLGPSKRTASPCIVPPSHVKKSAYVIFFALKLRASPSIKSICLTCCSPI